MQLLFSPDIAVIFSVCCCRFPRFLPFPSVSAVFVSCFCTKTFGICTKQNIFCTKSGGNFSMSFQFFPDIFYPDLELFCFFPWVLPIERAVSEDLTVLKWQDLSLSAVCFSCLLGIGLIDFLVSSCFFSCIFVVCRQKKLCCSFIRIIRFRDFFASSGYFFVQCWEIFSSHSRFFSAFPEFFSKEKPVFFGFRFPFPGIFPLPFESFSSFFPCSVENFSLRIHNFSTFLRTFRRENSHFPEWVFPPAAFSGEEFLNNSGIFSVPGAFFSAGLVQAPAVFFLRHPDFHLKSFTFYGCCLPCFFQPYRHFFPFFCLSRLWKISCFPASVRTFCTDQTRSHSHARNNILSTLSGFLFLLPQDMP